MILPFFCLRFIAVEILNFFLKDRFISILIKKMRKIT